MKSGGGGGAPRRESDAQIERVFGPRVKKLRLLRGLRPGDLAAATGTSRSNISHIEAGRTLPTIDGAAAISRTLGTTLDYLGGLVENHDGISGPADQARTTADTAALKLHEAEKALREAARRTAAAETAAKAAIRSCAALWEAAAAASKTGGAEDRRRTAAAAAETAEKARRTAEAAAEAEDLSDRARCAAGEAAAHAARLARDPDEEDDRHDG